MKTPAPSRLAALFAAMLLFPGCAVVEDTRQRAEKQKVTRQNQAHAAFRTQPGWRKQTYRNEELLAKATAQNTAVEIALREQRGILLVDGAVAMDFPVATGKSSHPTPKGSYKILEKKEKHASNLYGHIVSGSGSTVVSDADTRDHGVPAGGRFIGAPMPYWMRMTTTGVGMHVGNVPGHRTASHGCIRLKKDTAVQLFSVLVLGSPVTVDSFAPALGGPLGAESVVVAEVTAKPRARTRPKPKAPAAPVAEQPVQVVANEPQIGSPANEVSSAPETAPAEAAPQSAESVIEQIVAPRTTTPEPAPAPPAPVDSSAGTPSLQ
ncbi:MAG: L,D-transpeptidase [Chthoniobacterales bacterium]